MKTGWLALPLASSIALLTVVSISAQSAADVPKLAQTALTARYGKTWTVAPQPSGCSTPAVLKADFNADGHADYALRLTAGTTKTTVILTERLDGYGIVDLQQFHPDQALSVAKAGTPYQQPGMPYHGYLDADTLLEGPCNAPTVTTASSMAYLWTGWSYQGKTVSFAVSGAPAF